MRWPWILLASASTTAACASVLGLDSGSALDPGTSLDGGPAEPLDAEEDTTIADAPGFDARLEDVIIADAGSEAGHADAAPPPPRTEPGILCGPSTCIPNTTKCAACGDAGPQCQAWQAPLNGCAIFLCDDTADCSSGSRCCAHVTSPDVISTASCRTSCGSDYPLCDPADSGCPSSFTCKPLGAYFACQ